MLKGYYVHEDLCRNGKLVYGGVKSKIEQQIGVFSKFSSVDEVELKLKTRWKLRKRLPFGSNLFYWDDAFRRIVNPDFIYIRKVMFDKGYWDFIKRVKGQYPHAQLLLELPTYPYDREQFFNTPMNVPLFFKDWFYRRRMRRYIDRIVTYSTDAGIFGIPTICIHNGIDCDSVSPREPSHDGTTINVACAAAFSTWHGVDRVIEGMKKYITSGGQSTIHFHLMGEGAELPTLKNLVSQYKLDEYFTFYGQCNREQMDRVYNQCTISLASLGMHRIGLQVASTLKTREYLAKGMPFIYAGEIDVFLENPVDFCLRVPADDNPINIKQLVEFHNELYAGKEEHVLIDRIRQYAIENVSMEKAMANVVGYIKEHSCE